MKYDIVDGSTLFHFTIGAVAGVGGMDPKTVLLVALVADAAWEMFRKGSHTAAFEIQHGQSKVKEIANLIAIISGATAGEKARAYMQAHEAAPPHAPTPPAAAAPTTQVSGLGMYLVPGSPEWHAWLDRYR